MSEQTIEQIHNISLEQIKELAGTLASQIDSTIGKSIDFYKNIPNASPYTINVKNYLSDHLPIYRETEEHIIIMWNIGIGNQNQSQPYLLIKNYIVGADKKNYWKNLIIDNIITAVLTYVKNMMSFEKPIILHLQECSYNFYRKLNLRVPEIIESVGEAGDPPGLNFTSDFMPQVIAEVKNVDNTLRVWLHYVSNLEGNLKPYTLGLSSFLFCHDDKRIDLKLYPTSANLFEERIKSETELHLESRINLVLINIDEKQYIHYNLHFKKQSSSKQIENENRRIENRLKTYSETAFVDIIDQTKDERKYIQCYKKALIDAIEDIAATNDLITLTTDHKLTITNKERFLDSYPKYMCGDFNQELINLSIPPNINFTGDIRKDVDYILELRDPKATVSSGKKPPYIPPHLRDRKSGEAAASSDKKPYEEARTNAIGMRRVETRVTVASSDKKPDEDTGSSASDWRTGKLRPREKAFTNFGSKWGNKYLKYKEKYLKLKLELGL